MTTEQAKLILGITEEDNARTAKIKFRRLIGKYHPDAAGEAALEYQEQAQKINAAYSFLKNKDFFVEKEEAVFWNAKINEAAFISRNIYTPYHMDIDSDGLYQTAAHGKYMWDPDEEEFGFFLKSILHAAKELLDEVEERCDIYGGTGKIRIPYQEKLFHCLAQQFIDPLECFLKIAAPDTDGEKFTLLAYIGEKCDKVIMNRIDSLQKGDAIYPLALKDWRLIVCDAQRNSLGHLSFAEDELYYCLFPLMKAHLVQVKMTVIKVQNNKGNYLRNVRSEIEFCLKLSEKAMEYQNPDVNPEISKVLANYRRRLMGF
ncbi:MAG: J domain-containing protein [Lachnospiraceae bacterium]|nr:J domain-containing protein [Lachnospiraceae bacterium]